MRRRFAGRSARSPALGRPSQTRSHRPCGLRRSVQLFRSFRPEFAWLHKSPTGSVGSFRASSGWSQPDLPRGNGPRQILLIPAVVQFQSGGPRPDNGADLWSHLRAASVNGTNADISPEDAKCLSYQADGRVDQTGPLRRGPGCGWAKRERKPRSDANPNLPSKGKKRRRRSVAPRHPDGFGGAADRRRA
jgi:hypothetical protein